MADALDTVKKLMALALNNPNAEEARSAALKAVQMIRAHGIILQLHQVPAPTLTQASLADAMRQARAKTYQDLRQAVYYQAVRYQPFVWPSADEGVK
jgi:hypothetical protein